MRTHALAQEKLAALERLQKVDLEIQELRRQGAQHPARLAQLTEERDAARAALDQERGRLADNERSRRQQESLIQGEREKIRKWESRLNELKRPHEYAALAREVEIARKTNRAAEEDLARLAEEAEQIKAALAQKEAALAQKEAALAGEGAEIREKLQGMEQEEAALQKSRDEVARAVDRALLARYEQIRARRLGVALVPVIAGTCKGCNMNIPPQLNNRLLAGHTIELCPSCHRIIYAARPPPEVEASEGA